MTAREAAVRALVAFNTNNAWSDIFLNNILIKEKITGRDAALATRITYGVLQNGVACQWYVERFVDGSFDRLQPVVREILRTAVYQLVYMDRIPARAAVSEAVELAKKICNKGAASLVNAVLRKFSGTMDKLPPLPEDDWSIKYSHSKEFIDYFINKIGVDKTLKLLEADNTIPELTVRLNSLKGLTQLPNAKPHPWLEGFFTIEGLGNIADTDLYKNGYITAQDAAAALPVLAAAPEPGISLLDACAAPGGKTFLTAQLMENKGYILACDIHENKLKHINEGSNRLGITIIETKAMDASDFDEKLHNAFDIVLADVPCSGMGVIRKKPEIRYKSFDSISGLPKKQFNILDNLAAYVKPGGVLVYSTCTLIEEENEGVSDRFLSKHSDFYMEGFTLPQPIGRVESGRITLWPFDYNTDGFYICKLRKRK